MSSCDNNMAKDMRKFLWDLLHQAGDTLAAFSSGIRPQPMHQNSSVSYHESSTRNDADIAVSEYLKSRLLSAFPGYGFISEESTSSSTRPEGNTWVVDPIDGSDNFYRGVLSYSIVVTLLHDLEAVAGAVYEPYLDRFFFAEKGGGATVDNRKLCVSSVADRTRAVVATSRFTSFDKHGYGDIFDQLARSLPGIRISASTALDMCHVAAGCFDARILADTKVWDNTAATLILREAGGEVTDWTGNPPHLSSCQVVASNGVMHEYLLSLLAYPSMGRHPQ